MIPWILISLGVKKKKKIYIYIVVNSNNKKGKDLLQTKL